MNLKVAQLGEGLGEWYVASIIDTYESEARQQRTNEEKLALQTDHERLVGLLTQAGISTQQPIVHILEQCQKTWLVSDSLFAQCRAQWERYVDQVHQANSAKLDACAADEPDYFRKFCNSVTFDNCFKNPLWASCSRPGVADTSLSLYPLLSTKKPLRPKQPLKTIAESSARAPKSTDVLDFVHLLITRAKTRAKHEELAYWHTSELAPMIQRLTRLIDKARAVDAVKDDSKEPEAEGKLAGLCDKSRIEWKEAFADPEDKEQVAEALQQLAQESSALEAKHSKLLTATPATLEYLSTFLTYLVASSLEGSTNDVAAVVRASLADLKQLIETSRAEHRICLDQEDALNTTTNTRRVKRARVEEKDPEQKDIRGAVAWLQKLDSDVHERLHKLREAVPSPVDFEKAREQAYSYAIYMDYAIWVQSVLRLVNPQTTILDAMGAVQPEPAYISWLKKHEQQARDKAAIEVDSQRRQAAAVADSLCVRLQDLNKGYMDLVTELRNTQDNADRDLLATHKPWNEKPISELHKRDLRSVFTIPAQPDEMPNATQVVAAVHRLQAFVLEKREVRATTYRALQTDVEYWLLGWMGLWLYEPVA